MENFGEGNNLFSEKCYVYCKSSMSFHLIVIILCKNVYVANDICLSSDF